MRAKLDLAHDWAVKHGDPENFTLTVAESWEYADAMYEQQEQRESKGVTEVIQSLTKDTDGNCLHFHHEFGHKKCMDCGASLEQWQPDWSQAPDGVTKWIMNDDKSALWVTVVDGVSWYQIAPSFNYQGGWEDSLRKRSEGK